MPTDDGTLHHLGETLRSLLGSRRQCGALMGLLAATALVSPAWAVASAVAAVGLGLARTALAKGPTFAQRHGVHAAAEDTYVIGYAVADGEEVRLTRAEVERNLLCLGTTGSGKTESLLGLSEAFLDKGSGMAYVDGKGDVSLYAKVVAIAGRYGRADDVLLLNFMTGDQAGMRQTNTFNPFARATQQELFRLLSVLSVENGDDEMRSRGKLTTLLGAFSAAMCERREAGLIALSPATLAAHLGLASLIPMADPDQAAERPSARGLVAYLSSLDGYDEERGTAQPVATIQEHAHLLEPLVRTLDTFASVYPHVFETQTPDIDVREIARNRRILLVALPALEKSGDELAAMGKVVTAALETIEMPRDSGFPLRGRAPFLVLLDEFGYYLTTGLAAVAARAPETGTCWMFSSQDIPATKRLAERESARVIEICETKLFMRTEEMEVTASLAMRRDTDTAYRGVRVEHDVLDLKGFGAGEMLVMRPGSKVFARCPYLNPPAPRCRIAVTHPVHLASKGAATALGDPA